MVLPYALNVALLEKVKQHILANPQHINMNVWVETTDETNFECGTTACIGGWLTIFGELETILPPGKELLESELKIAAKAKEVLPEPAVQALACLLKVSLEESKMLYSAYVPALFFISYWPEQFRSAYSDTLLDECLLPTEESDRQFKARMQKRAKVVCQVIDYFISHPEQLLKERNPENYASS